MLKNLLSVALLVVVLSGCTGIVLYRPDQMLNSRMTIVQAQGIINKWSNASLRLARAGTALRVLMDDNTIRIVSLPACAPVTIQGIYVWPTTKFGKAFPYMIWLCLPYKPDAFQAEWALPSKNDAFEFAAALYVLSHSTPSQLRIPEDRSVQAAFEKAVELYRAAAEKPALPEAAREYKVQADAAVAEQHYDDAIDLYEKALKTAPAWPEGHFNCALLMETVEDYSGAAREMQRYLTLVPDAPDARAAQDKIYLWKGKIQ
jgi:tetratricopeptide (TPR) repeat protein